MESIDFAKLSKKERKRLKREIEQKELEKKDGRGALMKVVLLTGLIVIVGLAILWMIREGGKPLPGQAVPVLGREHIAKEQWEKFTYNSNPPTSGSHDATWIKAGVYDSPQGEGYLIHSLEHGYVIISYNCEKKVSSIKYQVLSKAFAHETEEVHQEPMASESAQASESGRLIGDEWSSQQCKDLQKKLSDLANEKRLWKLIVVPRPTLDVPIALTAWGRIDKLDKFTGEEIGRFIDAFRNHGPEATPD